ncbi:MAG: hypothetical protein FJ315_00045 [SAR202 cluster bacterium]|nr:hypothetical protein [SAR202 cluster bacterium]
MTNRKQHLTMATKEEQALGQAVRDALSREQAEELHVLRTQGEDTLTEPLSETLPYLVLRAGRLM